MMEENHYQSALPDPGFLIRLRKQRYLEQLARDQQLIKERKRQSRPIQIVIRQQNLNGQDDRKLTNNTLPINNNIDDQAPDLFEEFFEEEEHYQKVTTSPNNIDRDYVEKRMPQSFGQQPQKSILKNSKMVPPPPPLPPPPTIKYNSPTNVRPKSRNGQPIRPQSTIPNQQNHVNYEAYNEQVALQTIHENLIRQRQQKPQTSQSQKAPATSFNGPFFRIEQVSPSPSNLPPPSSHQIYQEPQQSSRYQTTMSPSRQELSPNYDYRPTYGTSSETVVIWPPPSASDRSRPASVVSKNISDPERINLFERQKQQELEAMRLNDEKKMRSQEKQYYASQLQQQRIQSRMGTHQQQYDTESRNEHLIQQRPMEMISPASTNLPPTNRQTPINPQTPLIGSDPGPTPNLRVYEARPISALSDGFSLNPSWKQTYLIDEHQEISAKNEILTSDDVLERDQFDIDLLQRREAFIEKPEQTPSISRLGRRWQPPPEQPYIWPHTVGDEAAEYKWQPVVENPEFKKERKNFTPTNSPPHSPIRGRGTRPLDEVAQRQTRYLIQPSPDGSHRPKPAFKVTRSTPSGGFIPHAPNAVKMVKKRGVDIQGTSPGTINQQERDLQMFHDTTYHLVNDPTPRRRNSDSEKINDWEKIYDLPAHSSTITNRDPPPNIDVRKRLQLFERYAKRRSQSAHHSHENYNSRPLHISTSSPAQQKTTVTNGGGNLLKPANTSKPVARTRQSIDSNHLHPNYSPQQDRAPSSRSQHSIKRIIQATQVSPPPPSYENARRYVPPALPTGYRQSRKSSQRRSPPTQPSPGNTRRLMQAVQSAASSHQHSRPLSAAFYPGGNPPRSSHSRSSYHQHHQSSTTSAISPSTSKYL